MCGFEEVNIETTQCLFDVALCRYANFVFVAVFFALSRYFFASTTAHILALYTPMVGKNREEIFCK
jgi:hypothetical protein